MVVEHNFIDAVGFIIDSRYYVEVIDSKVNIIVKSLSGRNRPETGTRHNDQYTKGIERLLEILASNEIIIEEILIDSKETRRRNLSVHERRLNLPFPIMVRNDGIVELRKKIQNLQGVTARRPTATSKRGNSTKQVRFILNYETTSIESFVNFMSIQSLVNEDGITEIPRGLRVNDEIDNVTQTPIHRDGWIYIITNPAWPEWVKIGFSGNLGNRLRTFNTGVPNIDSRYTIMDHFPKSIDGHHNAYGIEQEIHRSLSSNQEAGDSKEWYKMSVEDAKNIILEKLGDENGN